MVITGKMLRILLIGFMCAVLVFGVPACAGEQKISPDGGLHMTPRIDGNRVVWADTDNQAIYLFDICSGGLAKKISSPDAKDPYGPEISENNVVWGDNRFSDTQLGNALVLYDISAGEEILTERQPHPANVNPAWEYFSQNNPSISGNRAIYWITNPWDNENREIYSYPLGSGQWRLISTYNDLGGVTNEHPRISGDRIVWADPVDSQYNILLYDVTAADGAKKQISWTSSGVFVNAINPDIDGNYIVWEGENSNGNRDIILYDIPNRLTTKITDDSAVDHRNPAISGDRIVWQENSNYQTSGWDIYRYNIKTKATDQITTDPYDQINPDVSRNYIVWQDQRDGNQIYLYTDGSPENLFDQFSCWLKLPDIPSQISKWYHKGWISPTIVPTQAPVPAPVPTNTNKGAAGALSASFTAKPSSGKAPVKVVLDASGSRSDGGAIASYAWDFGDGMSGTGSSGSHTYKTAGTYSIRLTVTDRAGRTDSAYQKVTVTGAGAIKPVTPTLTPTLSEEPIITASANPSTNYIGNTFVISGMDTYGNSPDVAIYIFVENATVGGSLPLNGVRPDNLAVHTMTGDSSTFAQVPVTDNYWSYSWDTSRISGGSLLPDSIYTFWIVNRSLNHQDLPVGPGIKSFGVTKLQVLVLAPVPQPGCAAGLSQCTDGCRDLKTDESNCGSCGNVCPSGQTCVNSVCTVGNNPGCTQIETSCNGHCINLQSAHDNCGSCGNVCPAGVNCIKGVCTSCPPPLSECYGICKNLNTDFQNCGTCGARCSNSAQNCCNGQCVDIDHNNDNCGECGKYCYYNTVCCNHACVDMKASTLNCGHCGNVCPAGSVCQNGVCVGGCQSGFTSCFGKCFNLQTSAANCGKCGNVCPSDHPSCYNGRCCWYAPGADPRTSAPTSCV